MRRHLLCLRALAIALIMTLVIGLAGPGLATGEAFASGSVRGEIRFDRITNARDLGGYKTSDGRTVKSRMLIRSAELAYASKADLKKLRDLYHIGTVIDLRYSSDVRYCKDKKISGAVHRHIPLRRKSGGKAAAKKRFKALKKRSNSRLIKYSVPYFRKIRRSSTVRLVTSKDSQKQMKKVFNALLANDEGKGVLLHCVAGKDRTGVASFMILVALGVSEEDAYKDFALTNTYLRNHVCSSYKKGKCGVRLGDLKYAVKQVKAKYGSLENFLEKAYGLDEAKIAKLRRIYTE